MALWQMSPVAVAGHIVQVLSLSRTYFTARLQSAIPTFIMGTLCIVGGVTGIVTGYAHMHSVSSISSLVAGVGYVFLSIHGYLTTPNISPLLHWYLM